MKFTKKFAIQTGIVVTDPSLNYQAYVKITGATITGAVVPGELLGRWVVLAQVAIVDPVYASPAPANGLPSLIELHCDALVNMDTGNGVGIATVVITQYQFFVWAIS